MGQICIKRAFLVENRKMNTTIEFYIFKSVYVSDFSSNWQFWFFGLNLPKKGISGLKQSGRPWSLFTMFNFSARGPTDATKFLNVFSPSSCRYKKLFSDVVKHSIEFDVETTLENVILWWLELQIIFISPQPWWGQIRKSSSGKFSGILQETMSSMIVNENYICVGRKNRRRYNRNFKLLFF